MIAVSMVAANVYEIVIEGVGPDNIETIHRVHMSQAYYRELCGATATHEYVLVQAVQFLLEKEPNTSILAEFDLPDIERYFPGFEAEIKSRLKR